MAPIIEYQDCKSTCPNRSCKSQGKKETVAYRLSRTGPWMLEKETASCTECGLVHHLRLEIPQQGGVRVHVEVIETVRGA
jgi:predicted CxxxxCH...CXXCH cytochrome family protein